jgi:hypothetical protein
MANIRTANTCANRCAALAPGNGISSAETGGQNVPTTVLSIPQECPQSAMTNRILLIYWINLTLRNLTLFPPTTWWS